MNKTAKCVAAFAALSVAIAAVAAPEPTALERQIADGGHKIITSDTWGGGHRIIFDFNGRRGWVVEPAAPATIRADKPWVWTMQWMGAFIERTGAPALLQRGFCHVHLEAFDRKADEEGLKALASFQDYLVKDLGFAPKAKLIGMSWGGFFSIRYAATYPEKVESIYLDAPLMNFDNFAKSSVPAEAAKRIGPWANKPPADGKWTNDPRMPVNLAAPVAKAGIPIILLYGGVDTTCVPSLNCEMFIPRFKAAGGNIVVKRRALYGHHPHGFEKGDIPQILKFFGAEK